jgi:DNA-binding NarL/FixJ family response regulator
MMPAHLDTSVGFEIDGVVIKRLPEVSQLKSAQDSIHLKQHISNGRYVTKKLPGKPEAREVTLTRGLAKSGLEKGRDQVPGVAGYVGSGTILFDRRTVSIVVVHRDLLFRQAIIELLSKDDRFDVIAHVSDTEEVIGVVKRDRPDVVLVDCELPGRRIEHVVERINFAAPHSQIVLLTRLKDLYLLRKMVALGVRACVTPDGSEAELRSTIWAVMDDVDRVILSVSRETVDKLGDLRRLLSEREVEVLGLAAKGLTNTRIAASLFIAEGTVKRHLTNIYSKLDVKSRIQAVNKAMLLGLLTSEVSEMRVPHD